MRRTAHFVPGIAILAGLAALASCAPEPGLAPPDIRYGEDMCAECGMIVSDDRFAAAMIVEEDGRRVSLAFDDIGCLVAGTAHNWQHALAMFVVDHGTRLWITASEATYLLSEKMPSPMAFNVAAFATRDAAERAAASAPGELFDFTQLTRTLRNDSTAGTHDPHRHESVRGS